MSESEIIEKLLHEGYELAQYASYAEIVGGISVNRPPIRMHCDAIYELQRELKTIREAKTLTPTK